ncbi:hypothetical protein SLEP1_g57148 [Rubroshorea leprosula]|uniref:Uncharacterized protein n=1 Tax=Rubroshorea leprosula TaxID=152421 RepID=A0AAV5MLK3_9ROSI|nr:hypothetical protein SLEP1_g57148 [Rubroshorea leprosula]
MLSQAHLKGRLIYNDIMIALEMVHRLKKKRQGNKDDSILFGSATDTEAERILGILKVYEQVSGQQIILSKSSIFFSSDPGSTAKDGIFVCRPKSLQVLGFRDFLAVILAMLAKQAWRLVQNSVTLFYQILKAKYFKDRDLLGASLGTNPSMVLRGVLVSMGVLRLGSCWRIGNGLNARVWRDNWMPSNDNPFPIAMPREWDLTESSPINLGTIKWNDGETPVGDVAKVNTDAALPSDQNPFLQRASSFSRTALQGELMAVDFATQLVADNKAKQFEFVSCFFHHVKRDYTRLAHGLAELISPPPHQASWATWKEHPMAMVKV